MRVKEEEFKTSHHIVLKWDLEEESAGTGALKSKLNPLGITL